MELTAAHFMLLLGTCSHCPMDRTLKHEELVVNLSGALRNIFYQTCTVHNMSIFISNSYMDQLPDDQQHLVERAIAGSFAVFVPVLLGEKITYALALRHQLLLFFVQNASQMAVAGNRNPRFNVTRKYKYLIVLLAGRSDTDWQQAEMSKVFGYFLHVRYNVDVLLLLADLKAGTVSMHTYYPFVSPQNCASTEAVPVPLRDLSLQTLYPKKMLNMNGCPLHVIVWQIKPYMDLHWERSRPEEQITGLDADVLKLIAGKLNFSLALEPNEPADLIGGVSYDNGSMTGAFNMLLEKRGNLTIGFTACQASRMKSLSTTQSYNQVEYVLVMRRATPYSVYEIMLFPFETSVWLVVLALHCTRLLLWLGRWRQPRVLESAWMIIAFALRVSYESSIFMFVHNAPSRSLPHSLEQAMEQGYSFIVDYATYRMTNQLPALKARTRIVPARQPVDVFEHLLAEPEDSRVAVLSTHGFVDYFLNRNREHQQNLVVASNKIMDNVVCVYFTMGSFLTSTINRMLFLMRSSGVAQHVINPQKRFHVSSTKTARLEPLNDSSDQFDESMRFIYAALNCLLFCEGISIGIFVLELLSRRRGMRGLSRLLGRL